MKRLDTYADRLHNIEPEVSIASNAANVGVGKLEGVKKTRRILEVKVLKTFDFMDVKLDYVHERMDQIEEIRSN